MANKSASAKKRARQSIKRRARNKSVISNLKSSVKAYQTALESGEGAKDLLLRKVISLYDKAAAKGVIHKRNASRNISKISKTISK
tara:strand:+ start:50 stop:307 length:258 start_codon:yes stop_codon:yes gene_type:complete